MIDDYVISSVEELREVIPEAAPLTRSKVVHRLGAIERRFVEQSPLVLIGTASAKGEVTVSPKGDEAGFVRIVDDQTLLIPDRPGNRLAFGLTNVLENPSVGILFLIPGSPETFRVDGTAQLTRNPALLSELAARGRPAVLVLRVKIERCYFHCSRAFVRSRLWEHQKWGDPFAFSWGEWAQQWFSIPDATAKELDEDIAREAREQL